MFGAGEVFRDTDWPVHSRLGDVFCLPWLFRWIQIFM